MFEKIGETIENLFDDIGEKIKNLAIIFAILGIITAVIAGLLLMVDYGFLYGLLVIILGCLAAVLGEFILYAFGEFICKITEIAENILAVADAIEKSNLPQDDVNKTLKKQIIMDTVNNVDEHSENENKNIPLPDECPNCFSKIKPTDKECPFCGYKLK